MILNVEDYRAPLALDAPWQAAPSQVTDLETVVADLVAHFAAEAGLQPGPLARPPLDVLRALLTQRKDGPVPLDVQTRLDAVLQALRAEVPAVSADNLPSIAARFPASHYRAAARTFLWRGDITRLAADAIVNAANSQMMGCFVPFHACIDNAIHWAAGPRLRADCGCLMRLQGRLERTGTAKATRAYNLPSRFVLHTVGPIVQGRLTRADEASLASCYRSCLDLAVQLPGVRSLAFCSISTGVFGFPKREAARVALDAVAGWMDDGAHTDLRVVFNVFGTDDEDVYTRALEGM